MNVTVKERTAKTSAWVLYTLIVLEILFMVSPFAAYYYSIYATPLNLLQEHQQTAWLTMYLLPHFTYSDSWLANGLLLISWPLILLGLALFVLGFCQIYWAKLTSKTAVEKGLYRIIRHPQYVALALVGLGSSLYWSRFIVVIAFVSMLCLYYFLARVEERICLQKFGAPYREYMERTGMFLPRRWEQMWRSVDWRLPANAWARTALSVMIFIVVIVSTTAASHLLRNHVLASLQTSAGESMQIVFLAPTDPEARETITRMLNDNSFPGDIAYVAPASWQVPELGLSGSVVRARDGSLRELLNPSTHGNPLSYEVESFGVVLTEAAYVTGDTKATDRLRHALNVRPVRFLEVDLVAGAVTANSPANESQWADIPVPTF